MQRAKVHAKGDVSHKACSQVEITLLLFPEEMFHLRICSSN